MICGARTMAGIQFLLRILNGSFRTDGIYDRDADFNVVALICPMRLMLAGDSRVAQDDRLYKEVSITGNAAG
jgi:hypothetical protein